MVSKLFLVSREGSGSVRAVFLLRQKNSERTGQGQLPAIKQGVFPAAVIRIVFCANSHVLCNTAVRRTCVCVQSHKIHQADGVMYEEQSTTKEALYTVQWWGILPNKWLLWPGWTRVVTACECARQPAASALTTGGLVVLYL